MSIFTNSFDKKVYSWKRGDCLPNVGDELAKKIIKEILLFRDIEYNKFSHNFKGKLFSIGSVLHFSRDNDVLWGTGLNGKIDVNLHKFKTLDVRAVRGPKTRDFLLNRGIQVPEIYGDPALLTPLFMHKKAFLNLNEEIDFLTIPHMSETDKFIQKFGKNLVCSPLQKPYDFIRNIINAKKIFSSSLHGIILAEAYDIPVVWLKSQNGEDDFKYLDYYQGTGRFEPINVFDFEGYKCFEFGKIENLSTIQMELLKSFPFDLWDGI